MGFVTVVLLGVAGCGLTINNPALLAGSTTSPGTPATGTQIHGHIGSAQSSISSSSVQLYAAGTLGMASSATALLAKPVQTDSSGNFTISTGYICPSSNSQLYLLATGGNPGLASGTSNAAIAVMTLLGPCSGLSQTTNYPVDEVTTIGSVWPLVNYMASATQLGAGASDASFTTALGKVSQLVDLVEAVSPGTGVPSGYAVQTGKLYTLADDLHACVVSSGGTAGDSSPCGLLLSLASVVGTAPPQTILDAALNIARSNQLSVDGLFQFMSLNAPFQPVLPSPPTDWDLNLVAIPAAPIFTPAAGAYAPGQFVMLSSASGATIHYTTDGSKPATNSPTYSEPLSLNSSETVNAIAVTEDVGSSISSAKFTVATPASTTINVSVAPSAATLSASQTQQFVAAITGSSSSNASWSISPAVGSISATGLYTAPANISGAQTIIVTATVGNSATTKTATANVSLTPPAPVSTPLNISVTPTTATLSTSQSRQFVAAVTGASNSPVTWTINPAVGSVSATGLYTAPETITGLQTVTITANVSSSGVTKTAPATISLTAAGAGNTTYYVDNVGGNDSNNGTSTSTPFSTVAKVNTLTLLPGQTVAFKTGDTWHEMLTVAQSGSSGNPILYTSYGTGQQPVIDASDTVTGWTQGGSSAAPSLSSNIWTHAQAVSPLLINFAGQAGTPVANSAALSAPNQFYWNGSTLYVYSTTDPTTIVEIAARASALTSAGASYINVTNLELRGGTNAAYCGVAQPCTNWDFDSNRFDSAGSAGLRWAMNIGVAGGGLVVNNNIFTGTGGSGISLANGGAAMGDTISNNTMSDLCKIYIAGSAENAFCDAMNLFSQTGTDGGGTVLNNTISQVGLQSGAAYGGGIHPDTVINWDVEHNMISNTNYPGIEFEKGSGSTARYNLLTNTGQYPYFGGLFIRAGDGLSVASMLAEYNTVVGGYWACALGITQNAGAVVATNITMDRNICIGSTSGTQFWLDPGFVALGDSFSTNGFGVASQGFVRAGSVLYGSYQLLPAPIINSIAGDPEFVDPGAGNYTLQPASPDLAIGAFPES